MSLNTNLTNTSTTVYIPTYGTGVTAINDTDKVRIYKDTRNVKYMVGAFTVNTAVSDGSTVLVIPTDALPSFSNQIWVSVQHISTGRCYNLLFSSKNITLWGATSMPTGSYSINCVYI